MPLKIAVTAASGRLGHATLRWLSGGIGAGDVVAVARQAGVRRVLFTSIIGNGCEMATLFAATQRVNRQTEADLQASGLQWVIGRNALYLELDLIRMRKAREVFLLPGNDPPVLVVEECAVLVWCQAGDDLDDCRHALLGRNGERLPGVGAVAEFAFHGPGGH